MAQTKSKSPVQFDPEEGNDENIDIPVTLDGIDLSGLSVPQHNACDILAQTSVAQLRRFNLAMELPCCDKVNTQIVLAFTPFCAGKGVDLSSEGITAFKLAHGLPGNPTRRQADLRTADSRSPIASGVPSYGAAHQFRRNGADQVV